MIMMFELKEVPHMTTLFHILKEEKLLRDTLEYIKTENRTRKELVDFLLANGDGELKISTADRCIMSLKRYSFVDLDDFVELTDLSERYLNNEINYSDYILSCLVRNLEWAYFLPDIYNIIHDSSEGISKSRIKMELENDEYVAYTKVTIDKYLGEILQVLDICKVIIYRDGKAYIGERKKDEVLSYARHSQKELLNKLLLAEKRNLSKPKMKKIYRMTVRAHLPRRKWRNAIITQQKEIDKIRKMKIVKHKEQIVDVEDSKWRLQDTLYKWQEDFLNRWMEQKNGIAKVVTGAGKTHLAMAIIEKLKKEHTDLRVTIVVPTIVLLEQWLQNLMYKLRISRNEIALKGGGYSDSFEKKNIFILVINSAIKNNLIEDITENFNANLLIVDECHRAGAPNFRKIFLAKRSFNLGLSATPERETDDAFEKILVKELGGIIGVYTYKNALDDNIIPKYSIYNYAILLNSDEERRYKRISEEIRQIRKALKYKYPFLEKSEANLFSILQKLNEKKPDKLIEQYFLKVRERKENIYQAENRKKLVHLLINNVIKRTKRTETIKSSSPIETLSKADRIILFHELIAEINQLYVELNSNQVSIYHSGFPDSLNRIGLDLYKSGTTKVILSAKALIEGVDVPMTNVGIIMASSSSRIQRIQSLGRILRRAKGKKETILFILHAKNTTDELIFKKINWDKLIGEGKVQNKIWTEYGEINP